MKIRIALALIVAVTLVGQLLAGERFKGTWWNGIDYRKGQFEPAVTNTGRPPLVSHTTWESEKSPKGTIIRVGKGYLTADENGLVHVSSTLAPGSYWVMREVKSERDRYNAKDDWRGTWWRTTYTLEPTAPGLRDGKLGFRDGKLTVHPKNEGLAILSATYIDAEEISGK
jgi:hypothetical protein